MSSTVVMSTPTVLQGTTSPYTAILKDETNTPIDGTILDALLLTYYDVATRAVINTREAQNVLNTNNVTIDVNGLLTWVIQPADAIILDPRRELEAHQALFTFSWAGGTRIARHEIQFFVEAITFG